MPNGRTPRKRKTGNNEDKMESKIVRRSEFVVVGMKYRGKSEKNEIPQLWQEFMPRAREIKHRANPCGYGVMDNYDEKTGEFDYLAGAEVSDASQVPQGMESWRVPERTYAVFTCNLKNIKEAFQQIYRQWLPQSGCQRTQGPEFEFYDESFRPDQGKLDLYIYIPIEEA
jgi:AraC family transcriptional regulator